MLKWQLKTKFKGTFVSQQRLDSTVLRSQSFMLTVSQEKTKLVEYKTRAVETYFSIFLSDFSPFWKPIKAFVLFFFLNWPHFFKVYFLKVEMSLHMFESIFLSNLWRMFQMEETYNTYLTELFGDFPLLCIWAFFPLKHQNLIIVAEG